MPRTSASRPIDRLLHGGDRLARILDLDVRELTDREYLRQLPDGTFGKELANFLDRHQLQPLSGIVRRKQLHDSVHVLTGYEADPLGEAEVQAFLLGAKFFLPNLLLGMGLLGTIRRKLPQLNYTRQEVRRRIWQAYWRGRNSHFDPDLWQPETLLEMPLDRVRSRFGIA